MNLLFDVHGSPCLASDLWSPDDFAHLSDFR
jgi:hypothetical protein